VSGIGYAECTRWIGDAYEAHQRSLGADGTVKRNALVQTPGFVGGFLLTHTMEPALDEVPLAEFRMLDPCCGTGHILCQAFDRLFARWLAAEPNAPRATLAQRTLDAIHGVDIDRMAVALARFRLAMCASNAAGVKHLETAPRWRIHVHWGDSLLPADDPLQPFRREPIPPWCAGGLGNRPGDPHEEPRRVERPAREEALPLFAGEGG
jgi:hypothetical protein